MHKVSSDLSSVSEPRFQPLCFRKAEFLLGKETEALRITLAKDFPAILDCVDLAPFAEDRVPASRERMIALFREYEVQLKKNKENKLD